MKYISVGFVCNIRYQIEKHRQRGETLFFDWLMTSFDSVVEILKCQDINTILYADNIGIDINKPYHNDNSRIVIKSLDFCVSIHDFKKNYSRDDILNFIEQYKRRFNRIIEHIKSNEHLIFIRERGAFDKNIRDQFIETILKINPLCNFTLVFIEITSDAAEILKDTHYLNIKIKIDKDLPTDWQTTHFNWGKIFLDIENNI